MLSDVAIGRRVLGVFRQTLPLQIKCWCHQTLPCLHTEASKNPKAEFKCCSVHPPKTEVNHSKDGMWLPMWWGNKTVTSTILSPYGMHLLAYNCICRVTPNTTSGIATLPAPPLSSFFLQHCRHHAIMKITTMVLKPAAC